MYCPKCGLTNDKPSSFCTHCGEELSAGPAEEEIMGDPVPLEKSSERHSDEVSEWLGKAGSGLLERFKSFEELAYGQVVIIAARWVLVVAGLLLTLWYPDAMGDPAAMGELRISVMLILGLAVANFFLHAQVLMRKPVLASVAYAASAADIAVISLVVIASGGFSANAYVFYFPALLALSVAFRSEVTFAFAGSAIVTYGLISMATMVSEDGAVLATRLLMLAAVAVCGNVYWRTERDRRKAAVQTRDDLREQLQQEVAAQ